MEGPWHVFLQFSICWYLLRRILRIFYYLPSVFHLHSNIFFGFLWKDYIMWLGSSNFSFIWNAISLPLFISFYIFIIFFLKKHYVGSHLQVKSLILTNVLQLMKWWSMCWRYCRHEFVSSVVHKAFALYVISAFCFRLLNV